VKQDEFAKVVEGTFSNIQQLLKIKGGEYASSEDHLANFKRGATLTGCSPLQVLFIYLSKHYDALATYIRDEASGTVRERSEDISGRLDDLIHYGILAKALIQDLKVPTPAAYKGILDRRQLAADRPRIQDTNPIYDPKN
jgi:hypothetical protein